MSEVKHRVLFVDHTPFVGGAQLVLAEHISLLDRRTFEPLVACTSDTPELQQRFRDAGAEVHVVRMGRLRSAAAPIRFARGARELRKLVRSRGVRLVVANTSRAAYVASVATLGTNVPLVWCVRDFLFGKRVFRAFRPFPRRIIGVSRAIRDSYGPDDGKFSVIYVGSNLHESLESVTDGEVAAERARWGFGPSDVVVGFMGRVVADKGPQDLVDAARWLERRYAHIKMLIVGTGAGQSGDIEHQLREQVARNGLRNVVFAGHQANEALYYRLFDIFALCTRTPEPYATSVVQAMMARVPVIATATGGTPELVRDGVTGVLIPPARPDLLAGAIVGLANDSSRAQSLAQAGHGEVMEHNTAAYITSQFEQEYRAVLQGFLAAPASGSGPPTARVATAR